MAANTLIQLPANRPVPAAAEKRIIEAASRAGIETPLLGVAPAPSGPVHWQATNGRWWLINEFRADPTAEQHGGVVVPADIKIRLEKLLREGFAPDLVLIGHEMPGAYSPGDPMPSLVPATTTTPAALPTASPDLALDAARDGAKILSRVALATGRALATLGSVAVTAGAAVGRLDPVIVAGIDIGEGEFLWVEVARWDW